MTPQVSNQTQSPMQPITPISNIAASPIVNQNQAYPQQQIQQSHYQLQGQSVMQPQVQVPNQGQVFSSQNSLGNATTPATTIQNAMQQQPAFQPPQTPSFSQVQTAAPTGTSLSSPLIPTTTTQPPVASSVSSPAPNSVPTPSSPAP